MTKKSIAALGACVLLLSNTLMPLVGVAETLNTQEATSSSELVTPLEEPVAGIDSQAPVASSEAVSAPEKQPEKLKPEAAKPTPSTTNQTTESSQSVEASNKETRAIGDKVDFSGLEGIYYEIDYNFLSEAEDYTVESWRSMSSLFEKVKSILEEYWYNQNFTVNQVEADQLEEELVEAKKNLVLLSNVKDITDLTELVSRIKSENLVADDYTTRSWDNFNYQLDTAESIITDFATNREDNWSQKDIISIRTSLDYYYNELLERVKNPTIVPVTISIPKEANLVEKPHIVDLGEGITVEIHQWPLNEKTSFQLYMTINGVKLGYDSYFGNTISITADDINESMGSNNGANSKNFEITVEDQRDDVEKKERFAVTRFNYKTPNVYQLAEGYTLSLTYSEWPYGDGVYLNYVTPTETYSNYLYDAQEIELSVKNERINIELYFEDNPNFDKNKLMEQINFVNSLTRRDFTGETWEVLRTAYVSGYNVLYDEETSQISVNQSVADLSSALKQLEWVSGSGEIDKESLGWLIDSSKNLVEKRFTPESWQPFAACLKKAEEVFGNETASWYELQMIHRSLTDAKDKLVRVSSELDFAELNDVLAQAKAIKKGKYSQYSWNKLQNAIVSAESTVQWVQESGYDDYLQDLIDQASTDIQKAIDDLKEAVVSTKTVEHNETLTGTRYYFGDGDQKEILLEGGVTAYLMDTYQAESKKYSLLLVKKDANGEKLYMGQYFGTYGESLSITNDELNEAIEWSNENAEESVELLAISYKFTIKDGRDQSKVKDLAVEINDFDKGQTEFDFDGDTLRAFYDPEYDRIVVTYGASQYGSLIGFFDHGDSITIKTKTGLVRLAFSLERVSPVNRFFLTELISLVNVYNTWGYTQESIDNLNAVLEKVREVQANLTASQEQVDQALNELQSALDGLIPEEVIDLDALYLDSLSDIIEELTKLKAADYTENSWRAFTAILAKGEEVLAKYNQPGQMGTRLEQAEIDSVTSKLHNAQVILQLIDPTVEVPEKLDVTKLQLVIKAAEGLEATDYTQETWQVVVQDLADAKSVLAKAEAQAKGLITQEEVDNAAAKLTQSINALVKKHVLNVTTLKTKISEAKALDQSLYTETSWNILLTNLENAEKVVLKVEENVITVTQAEIDQMTTALSEAVSKLVQNPVVEIPEPLITNKLETAILTAQGLNATDYTELSWNMLATHLLNAKAMLEAATEQNSQTTIFNIQQQDIDSVVIILNQSIKGLVLADPGAETKPVELSQLKAIIKKAEEVETGLYTEESLQLLNLTLTQAKTVLSLAEMTETTVTQGDVEQTVSILEASIKALVLKETVTPPAKLELAKLMSLITKADTLVEIDYTEISWQTFSAHLKLAKDLLAKASAQNKGKTIIVQADVDSMVDSLQGTMEGLVKIETPKPVELILTKLQSQIKEAQTKNEKDYTIDSWQALVTELKVATAVLERGEAQNNQRSLLTQTEVDLAAASLAKAISGLVPVGSPTPKPTPAPTPKPGGTGAVTKPIKTDTSKKVVTSATKKLPQTNGVTSVLPNLVGAGALFGSVVAYIKSRKNKK